MIETLVRLRAPDPLDLLERSADERADPLLDDMSAAELLEYLQVLERERSRLDALRIRALARFSRLRSDRKSSVDYVGDEVAAALTWTPVAASRRVNTAVELVGRLPDTVAALARGELDLAKAVAINEHTRVVTVDKARRVESRVLLFAPGRTIRQVRDKLSREILLVDRDGAEVRRRERMKDVTVRFRACADGMAEILVYDTMEHVRPMFDLLTTVATGAKAAGSRVGMDALRAKALHDLMLGPGRDRVVTEFRVTIPASALAGASRQPAEAHGYGPSTLAVIHELADRNTFWRRIVTDPMTGAVLDVGRRRRHPDALGEHIRARDKRCVFPGCGRPAGTCEIDHTDDHALGGATAEANLGALCRHHNLMKLDGQWELRQPEPGRFIWTSPTGAVYEVTPEPVVDLEHVADDPAAVLNQGRQQERRDQLGRKGNL